MIVPSFKQAVLILSMLFIVTTIPVQFTDAYSVNINQQQTARRELFRNVLGTTAAAIVTISSSTSPVNAISPCPARSSNCIRTTWTASSGTDVGKQLYSIIQTYPQEGQADVDLGGWNIASGNLLAGDTSTRIEFSSGIGKFAKFFNGGKPFIDDLDFEIVGNTVEVRSASRVGDSDFDVNKKRLLFLGEKARALGWTVPDPKY